MSNPLIDKATTLAREVKSRGGRALIVGGYVRDELLGLEPKDADIEVFGLEAKVLFEVLRRIGRVDCVGESFRVYKLGWHDKTTSTRYEVDVSLPRRDKKVGQGHKGFEVEGDPFASVEEAARRRDFTINAILRDPLSGEILDPFGGRVDLQNSVLRVVDADHFGEDSLRVLRAAQFAGRFDLQIEPATVELCRSIDLHDLPKERVWGEWEKLLLKSPKPSVGLRAAWQLNILEQLFPYLQSTVMRRGKVLLSTLDGAAQERSALDYPRQIVLMLTALGMFLGWRAQSRHGIERLLDDLNIHTINGYDVRKTVMWLRGERKRAIDWYRRCDAVEDKEFRFLAARGEPRLVYNLTRARGAFDAAEWFRKRCQELEVFDGPPSQLLMGRHLLEMGMKPGPQIGQIVNRIWIAQLSGDVTNSEEAKTLAQNLMKEI
jgi:tRNA nucleotidyltransferase (CCA-adding enzyme)